MLVVTVLLVRERRSVLMAAGQLVATAAATAAVLQTSTAPTQPDLGAALRHYGRILEQAWEVVGRSILPFEGQWRIASVAGLVLLMAGGVIARRRRSVRQPLALAVAGIVTIVACYAVLAPSGDYYAPLAPGQGTRTNAAAAVGYALLVTGLAGLVAGGGGG
ncbi:MAG: hypothetical protein ACR2NB_13465, partial [Solirubrobacteraceae bacterium]